MAPKARGDGKANDGETKSGGGRGKGGGKNRGGDAQWDGEEDGGRRKQGQGKGNRKGGKAESGGGDDRWHQGGGRNRGQGQHRGGYEEEEYYEGGYSYGGGSGYGYGYDSWQAGPQDWQPMPPEPAPAPPPKIWTEYEAPDGTPYYYNCRTGLTQWDRPKELDPPPPEPVPAKSANDGETGKGRGRMDGSSHEDSSRSGGRGRGDNRRSDGDDRGGKGGGRRGGRGNRDGGGGGGKDKGGTKQDPSDFGPPGCNLFVFHLPDDWTDDDLHEYFAPHGNVISAKVMKELGTGRSRGFGFVSYEDRVSAATAVKKMQGYKILGKRLKVEFKKGEGESSMEDGAPPADAEDAGNTKKSYPDDERLIGYLRAISAKSAVESLKEKEGGPDDEGCSPRRDDEAPIGKEGGPLDEDILDAAHESELPGDLPNDD